MQTLLIIQNVYLYKVGVCTVQVCLVYSFIHINETAPSRTKILNSQSMAKAKCETNRNEIKLLDVWFGDGAFAGLPHIDRWRFLTVFNILMNVKWFKTLFDLEFATPFSVAMSDFQTDHLTYSWESSANSTSLAYLVHYFTSYCKI